MKALARRILRHFGYYRIDYGFAVGRHWIEIDGRLVAPSRDAHVWLSDRDVHRLGYGCVDCGKHWTAPDQIV